MKKYTMFNGTDHIEVEIGRNKYLFSYKEKYYIFLVISIIELIILIKGQI